MKYTNQPTRRRWPKRLLIIFIVGVVLLVLATAAVRIIYYQNLRPLSQDSTPHLITVNEGDSVDTIAGNLQKQKIIRSSWAFRLYVSSKEVGSDIKAGSYDLAASQSVSEIVALMSRGKVATNLVTILPGQRIDQVKTRLLQDGFNQQDVDTALNPATYAGHPALVDKPPAASLEGYLYPDSYQKTANTSAKSIIKASLDQMNKHLTPDLRAAFAKQGLSTYQAVILASIIEKEVPEQNDRDQVAQVFLLRLRIGMKLQSDATAAYGAIIVGQKPSLTFDSAYNTYNYAGLPPGPISNVSAGSLRAVAYPAATQWLYFVSGDDGTAHYAKNLADHQANVQQYCKKACAQ